MVLKAKKAHPPDSAKVALPSWLRAHGEVVTISLAIQPGSKTNAVVGLHGDALKLKIAAPPVEGAANEALVEFLAERLQVRKSQVRLLKGASSRQKVVEIIGLNAESVAARLTAAPAL